MAWNQWFPVTVLFAVSQMFCTVATHQLKCGIKVSVYKMLRRHTFHQMKTDLVSECLNVCNADVRCQSFNYVMSKKNCELNNRTKEARPEDFVSNEERHYMERDRKRVPLGSIPELPAESCKEIKSSEGGEAANGKYWFDSILPGKTVLAYCDMKTEDIDECSASPPVCDVNATCQNNPWTYNCTCNSGFTGDGHTCADIDECKASPLVCDVNATCQNIPGSYNCTCNSGFTGDGHTCADIDECKASPLVCDVNATCQNIPGSYNCTCYAGFTGDGHFCAVSLNSSAILGNLDNKYLEQLISYLNPVLLDSARSWFARCYHAKTEGWVSTTFHSNCDGKGPTVTIIQVNSYIFGGYTNEDWRSACSSITASKAFIFSLYNSRGYSTVKLTQKQNQTHSMHSCSRYGPTFGGGYDIYIANEANSDRQSYNNLGYTYNSPSGCTYADSCSKQFLAGTYHYSPTDVEVFYETTS